MTIIDQPPSPARGMSAARRWPASWPWIAALAIACLMLAILHVSQQRTHFGIGAESDFAGSFGPDAERILAGEPLELQFHPPGLPFAAALGRVMTGSWLGAGLWISGISALIVLVSSLVTFRRLAGESAAWGSLIACACSTLFLRSASTASSDMMFAALVGLTLALVVQALDKPDRLQLWVLSGIFAACTFLTRTNGLVAALVLLTPFLAPAGKHRRLQNLAALAAAFFLPLCLWAAYARITDSPLMPTGDYLNLAVAAYGNATGPFGDQVTEVQDRFENMIDVLAYDPLHMVSQFSRRLLSLPGRLLHNLTWPPIVALAVPGVVLMLWRRRTPAYLFYLLLTGGLTLLSGIVDFQARYFLVLIPLLGAMAGVTFDYLLDRFAFGRAMRTVMTGAALLLFALMAGKAYVPVLSKLETAVQREFAEAIPQVLRQIPPHARIYARKPNLAFETGRASWLIANVSTALSLHRELCLELEPGDQAYMYIGTMERQYRPELTEELAAAVPIPWLELIARGTRARWTLYRIRLYGTDLPQDQRCTAEVDAA